MTKKKFKKIVIWNDGNPLTILFFIISAFTLIWAVGMIFNEQPYNDIKIVFYIQWSLFLLGILFMRIFADVFYEEI